VGHAISDLSTMVCAFCVPGCFAGGGAAVEFAFGGEILYPELLHMRCRSRFSFLGSDHYETDSVPLDPGNMRHRATFPWNWERTQNCRRYRCWLQMIIPRATMDFRLVELMFRSRGLSIAHLLVSLYDPTRSALDSDALPTSIALSDFNSAFQSRKLRCCLAWRDDTFFAVPEPATGGMLALLAIVTCFPRTCGLRRANPSAGLSRVFGGRDRSAERRS
jgi:hypothetical protein